MSLQIIKVNEEKFQIIEKENEDLRKSVKHVPSPVRTEMSTINQMEIYEAKSN